MLPSIVWTMTFFSVGSRYRLDLEGLYSTGCVRTWSAEGNTSDSTGKHPLQQSSSTTFLRVPSSARCSSSCIQRMHSGLPRNWGFLSTGMRTTHNSTITVSPVIQPSSPPPRLAHCIEVMGQWMSSNRLKLNASKTEFIWLGSTRRLARCTFDPIIINGVPIKPSSTVRDLGAYIDSGMNFTDHVTRLTRTCFFHIRQLMSIRRSLTQDSSHALVRALILTRLDYCNGLLGGAQKCLLSPLSRVLRAAARLILLLPRTSRIENEIRTVLHWLDVPARVTFKLCVLAHRCLHGSAPPYLVRYFTPVSSIVGRTHLRSAAAGMLFVPRSQTLTIGPRAFAISSPSAWNSLPVDLRDPGLSLMAFRRRLKTYLFNPSGYLSS